jgi:hypothetical protein
VPAAGTCLAGATRISSPQASALLSAESSHLSVRRPPSWERSPEQVERPSRPVPAPRRRTCVNRSRDTTRTSSSTPSTPRATAANAAAASPRPAAVPARAGRRPQSAPQPDSDGRARASGARSNPARRRENQQPAERRRSRDRNREPEQPDDDASPRRLSGVREPAILLTTRAVHAPTASSSQPPPNLLSLSVASATSRSSHRCQTVPGVSVANRSTTRRLPVLDEIGPRMDHQESEKPALAGLS